MDTTKTNQRTVDCLEWFFGYGGNHLGLKRVIPNLRLIAACEIEAYACANMVAKMEAGLLDAAPVWTDCKTFPVEMFRGLVDIFIASYPCQGFSSAGKREGQKDPRFLWPWVLRAVAIIQPRYCFFENVDAHVSLGLSTVISDLEEAGYRVEEGIFSAAECGAPQQRKRVFILAKRRLADTCGAAFKFGEEDFWRTESFGPDTTTQLANAESVGEREQNNEERSEPRQDTWSNTGGRGDGKLANAKSSESRCLRSGDEKEKSGSSKYSGVGVGLANSINAGLQGCERRGSHEEGSSSHGPTPECRPLFWPGFVARPGQEQHAWEPPRVIKTQRKLGRGIDGYPAELDSSTNVDRLRLLGNGVYPAAAAKAFRTLIKKFA